MPLIPPLLRRPTFRNFWLGQTISVFGDQITLLAIPIVAVLSLQANPEQMGLLTAVGLLPHLLFSLPAGVWLDKVHRRRRLMIIADLLRAAVIATIAITYVMGNLSLEQLFVVTFIVGSLAVVFDISWNTLFVTIAERDEYLAANALFSGSRSLAGVAGPSIGGALIQFLTAPIAILVDAISYVGSALFLARVDAVEPPVVPTSEPIRAQLATGLAFIFRDPIMRPTIMSAATLNLFNFGFHALFILYVTTYLNIAPGLLGLALGAGAVGAVAGVLVAGRIGRRIGLGPAFVFGLVVFPAALILVPLADSGTPVPLIASLASVLWLFGTPVLRLRDTPDAAPDDYTPDPWPVDL